MSRNAYILAAYRTPGCRTSRKGRFGKGQFKDLRPDDLAAIAIKGLIEKTGIDPMTIDDVILGCAFPEAEQGMNVARIASHKAGLPYQVPAMTVNRFCSSGLQTIAIAAEKIMAGFVDCVIAGGTESMTMVPMGGIKYSANPELIATWPETYTPMGLTAEFVAQKHNISREDQDEFAYNSHMKAVKAINEGKFKDEIIPVEVEQTILEGNKVKKVKKIVDIDDGPRPETTIETLSKLKPAFKKDGTVTAGNSSQMTDAAAAVLVVSEDYLKKIQKDPMARFVAYAVAGVEPHMMGEGPIAAVPKLLNIVKKLEGITMDDIGLIELNEAFAAQSLACIRALGWNDIMDTINVNGGAIALGHPLGATGAKLAATLINEMRRRNVKYGLETMCIGGGMGAAGLFELV
ncbi:thiolase family protein [Hippea jasoniae]|uniref:thiolase family protein n=1 Tax=Hippea jasoniae TaxID=944479 RepID=UPI000555E0A6|nr:thiolase family protein [Hippea jasoniae]